MEILPTHPILEFNPDLLKEIRKIYNLDKPGDMDKAINILEDWIKQQNHIINKKVFSREYLERAIITQKGSIERAKIAIDRLCTARTLLPRFFEINNAREIAKSFSKMFAQAFLPKQTKEHYRIYVPQIMKNGFTPENFFSALQLSVLFCDYYKAVDYSDGIILISDFTNIDIIHGITSFNVVEVRQVISIFLDCFKVRLKATHLISPSSTIDLLVKFLKKILSKKTAERIYVHKSMEELHKYIPKEMLPADFGGHEKPMEELYAEWVDILSSEKNMLLIEDLRKMKSDEKNRLTDELNEYYMGMAGSFRTFTVD